MNGIKDLLEHLGEKWAQPHAWSVLYALDIKSWMMVLHVSNLMKWVFILYMILIMQVVQIRTNQPEQARQDAASSQTKPHGKTAIGMQNHISHQSTDTKHATQFRMVGWCNIIKDTIHAVGMDTGPCSYQISSCCEGIRKDFALKDTWLWCEGDWY